MKRLLFSLAFLLSSLFCFSQEGYKDTVFHAFKTGIKKNDTVTIYDAQADVKIHHKPRSPFTVTITKNGEESFPIVMVADTVLDQSMSSDGVYYFYNTQIESTKEKVLFAVKYNFNGTYNSVGILREDKTILIFYFKDSQEGAPKQIEQQSLK